MQESDTSLAFATLIVFLRVLSTITSTDLTTPATSISTTTSTAIPSPVTNLSVSASYTPTALFSQYLYVTWTAPTFNGVIVSYNISWGAAGYVRVCTVLVLYVLYSYSLLWAQRKWARESALACEEVSCSCTQEGHLVYASGQLNDQLHDCLRRGLPVLQR